MTEPREGTIQYRVLQVLIDHLGEPITADDILVEIDRDGGKKLIAWHVTQAIIALKTRGYEIEMDPLSSKANKSIKNRTFRLLQPERTRPSVHIAAKIAWEVVVNFKGLKEARKFAKALQIVTNQNVEVR